MKIVGSSSKRWVLRKTFRWMLFTRSSSTSDCSSSTGESDFTAGSATVGAAGFFPSSVRSRPSPSVVGSGGFSCPGAACVAGAGGGDEACARDLGADSTSIRHVTAARGRVKVRNLRPGLRCGVLASVVGNADADSTIVPLTRKCVAPRPRWDFRRHERHDRATPEADLGCCCVTVRGRMAASLRARLLLVVAAVALTMMACKADTDLGKPGCHLLKAGPDGGPVNVIVGELSAGKDFLSFGSVECEDLVCVLDYEAVSRLLAQATSNPAVLGDPATGYCSHPCAQGSTSGCTPQFQD